VRLNRFVSDLLDFSRLKAGAEPVRAELVAAEDVLGVALQRLGGPGAERVDARLPDGALLVGRMDFSHALRALVNLVENALKYSPPSSRVEVAAEPRPGRIAFIVADRGPGIAPDDRERVFEPFHRADQGGSAGTGLGLAIARRSAELQGGELGYQPRPGGGSIFTLLLPAAGEEELAAMSL
jgi:two-component system sensor histidine kinase KdpD